MLDGKNAFEAMEQRDFTEQCDSLNPRTGARLTLLESARDFIKTKQQTYLDVNS